MIGPRVVPDSAIDGLVRVAGSLSTKLPYCPVIAMLFVEEGYEPVEGVAIRPLGVRLGWAGACS